MAVASRASAIPHSVVGIARPRWQPLEMAFWLAPIVVFFLLPDRRPFISQIFVCGLLALSLDLILG